MKLTLLPVVACVVASLFAIAASSASRRAGILLPVPGELAAMISQPDFSSVLNSARAGNQEPIYTTVGATTGPDENHQGEASMYVFNKLSQHCGNEIGRIMADVRYSLDNKRIEAVSNMRFVPETPFVPAPGQGTPAHMCGGDLQTAYPQGN